MKILVYRHMGDKELVHLIANGKLPDAQPYQTIVVGPVAVEVAVRISYYEGYL